MSTSIEAGHQECCGRVYIVCFRKSSRSLSDAEIEVIKEYLIEGYKVDNPDLPSGICVGCSVALSKKWKDNDFPSQI